MLRLIGSPVDAELHEQDVAVEREQVDQDAVDAVAQAAGRAALLVVFEVLELASAAPGGMVPPGSTPSERSALSRSSASRSSVIALASSVGELRAELPAASTAPETERMPSASSSVRARRSRASALVASRCAMPMWVCASRAARVATSQVDPVAALEQLGDIGDGGHPQPHRAHARADGRDQVGLARRAQDPDGARRRLLERLEQHVRGALGHAVGVFDDDDAVAADRRRELRGGDELAHLVDRDDDAVGAEHGEVGVGARVDLASHGLVAARRPARAAPSRRRRRGWSGRSRAGR